MIVDWMQLCHNIFTSNFDVGEVRVDTQCQIAWECPRGGGPCYNTHRGVLIQWKTDNDYSEMITLLI